MTTPTFNKFKSTTIYGALNNLDYPDNTVQASAFFQRTLTCSGNIYGNKLYYNNTDISTLYAPLMIPNFLGSIVLGVIDPLTIAYNASIANSSGTINFNTYNGTYPLKMNASNFQVSKNNGTNYYDVLTTNTGASLTGATFTGLVTCNAGLATGVNTDVTINGSSINFPTTNTGGKQGLGFYWNKSGGGGEIDLLCYGQGGSGGLSIYASNVTTAPFKIVDFFPSGCTFTTSVVGVTPVTSDNSTKFATTAYVKAQGYLTSATLGTTYALLSGATFTGALNAITQTATNNSTLVATTAFVKAQNYLSSASLSNYALLTGANNWTAMNNFNVNTNGLATSYGTGLSIGQNVAVGQYETSFIAHNGNNGGGFRFYSSTDGTINVNQPLLDISPINNFTILGTTSIKQPDALYSVSLQFCDETGGARANIYSSVASSVFRFDIQSTANANGFEWRMTNNGGKLLMKLDLTGRLITAGSNTVCGTQQIIN